jgi:hypothetical protein
MLFEAQQGRSARDVADYLYYPYNNELPQSHKQKNTKRMYFFKKEFL